MLKIIQSRTIWIFVVLIVLILLLAFLILPNYFSTVIIEGGGGSGINSESKEIPKLERVITHLKTPSAVKGIYMSSCVAATPSFRNKLVKLIDETELNSVILDIKDYSGTISFKIDKPEFVDHDGGGCRASDMIDFINELHQKNIYVIGRITAFQDAYMTKQHPDWAVKKKSDQTVVWKDNKGISFIDAGNQDMWKFLVDLGRESYAVGFDELNFDYIRFPSDGDMIDIYFPHSDSVLREYATSTISGKSVVLKNFFEFLHESFKNTEIVTSADIFGMTTTSYFDLNIGQILEDAAVNFDYVAPMVYPSHFPPGFMGYKTIADVNSHPYEIIKFTMDEAVRRLKAIGVDPLKLRPWLQDNDYPVPYTPDMVRAQIQATYDVGLTSWMLWDAGNTYTKAALKND